MSNPYALETPLTVPALPAAAANKYRQLIARDEAEISALTPVAEELRNDLTACEDLIADLRKSVEARRHKLGEDTISLLGRETDSVWPMANLTDGQEITNPLSCAACGFLLAIRPDLGIWTHSGRELIREGYLCWPARTDSTVATPPLAQPMPVLESQPDEVVAPLPPLAPPAPVGELDERKTAAMSVFLDEHAGIGQDGDR